MEKPNLDYINIIADGDENFKQQLLVILKKDFQKEKQAFIENFDNKNYKVASEYVHKIKHKISMLGLALDVEIADTFEQDLKNINLSLHKKFVDCLNRITSYLNKI